MKKNNGMEEMYMKNNVAVANYNVTFGNEDKPLLEFFDSIIYPAFKSEESRSKMKDGGYFDKYYFIDVEIVEAKDEDYVLTGKIVKETTLEVKSKIKEDKLVATDEHYPSAPYSTFYLYLRNHRMLLIKNQKGSPDIRTFGVTSRYVIQRYIKLKNEYIKELNKNKPEDEVIPMLPYARVEVVGIPMEKDLKDALIPVVKMKKLRLRMYPLNGDLNINSMVESLSSELRDTVKSKTGNITLNSPESKDGVIKLINASQGVFDSTLEVEYGDKSKDTISSEGYSGKTTWNLTENQINDIDSVKDNMYGLESFNIVSEGNNEIYSNSIEKIKKMIE